MAKELTPQEVATLEAYVTIAAKRNRTHANPEVWRAEANELIVRMKQGPILDIGCGGGRDALLLRELGLDYVGVDLSPEMLAAARELVPDAAFSEMSLYDLRFEDESFAAFWAPAIWLHVPRARIQEALAEARRITKLAGVGFVALKEGNGEQVAKDGRFFTYWQQDDFTNELSCAGFSIFTHACRKIGYDNFLTWIVKRVR